MGDQFNPVNPALNSPQQEDKSSNVGLTPGDLLTLPDHQRRIVNWIIRHQESTLPEVAQHLGEDEPTAKNELDLLVKQGFIQEITGVGESRYSVKLAAKRGSHLSDKLY